MTTEHDVLNWLKDNHPDIYQRILSKSRGHKGDMIKIIVNILDKGSMPVRTKDGIKPYLFYTAELPGWRYFSSGQQGKLVTQVYPHCILIKRVKG